MSQSNKNKKNIVLIALIVILLVGACFATVTIYAKKQLNKPKFVMPEQPPVRSVTELPEGQDAVCSYVGRLYKEALSADDIEGSFNTSVNLDEDIKAGLKDSDLAILNYIRQGASGKVAEFYPSQSNVIMSTAEGFPELEISAADVIECTAEQGHTDEEGNVSDDAYYFITLGIDPVSVDTAAMVHSEVFGKIEETLAPAAKLENVEITTESKTVSVKIDRVYDKIVSVDTSTVYSIKADAVFTDDYKSLSQSGKVEMSMPFKTNEHIGFTCYGAKFTQPAMAVKQGDMKALPASVTVNSETTKEDYKLTFTPSEKDAVSIDEDGVMTVLQSGEKEITITMTLDYDGHTYSDEMTVYITDKEVSTDG